jgi:hypothetical protein
VNTRKDEQAMKTTKTVLQALWRLGRGTASIMGLAMLLALSVGLASTALAGTGIGARFDLGKTNTVNAISKLVGNVAGPSLQIDNNSANGAATALNLLVEAGRAPMKVNPKAGTATNLSADKLDGKSADELGVNGLEQVFTDSAFNSDSFKRVTASCPAGKVVVGTGYEFADDQQGIQEATNFGVIAVTTGTDLVEVSAAEQAPTSANWVVTAIAICAPAP